MKTKLRKQHYGNVLVKVDNYDVIDCKKCNFAHLLPIPGNKELITTYEKVFYEKEKPDYFERHLRDSDWWNVVYDERLSLFEKYLIGKRRSLLDIGSGPGFFLKYARDKGWKVIGIEPSKRASSYARTLGVESVTGFFNSDAVRGFNEFDVIHMQGVLEHLPTPKETVENCYKILKSGGLFCTVVANDFNPFQLILKNYLGFKPWWVVPSQHINYFTISSIKKLIESCKLRVIDIVTTFPMELFLLMGDNYVDNDKIGKICHNKRKRFEFSLIKGNTQLKIKLYHLLAKNNLGRDIILTAKKI